MVKKLFEDRSLMRIKDVLLIVAFLFGTMIAASEFYNKPLQNADRIKVLNEKYVPIIEENEKAILIMKEQNTQIIKLLQEISGKIK